MLRKGSAKKTECEIFLDENLSQAGQKTTKYRHKIFLAKYILRF